jgi:N-acetyl-gamma-glutamyl-phosphate reductase
VTGAGREAKIGSLYCEATDSLKAYGVPGHRHQPEIEQQLALFAGEKVDLTFVPHLTPMSRGIHATIYVRPKDINLDFQEKYELRYKGEPFVDVMPAGEHPETRSVRGNNVCRIAIHRAPDRKTLIILSVIDNLVKGASGQALQCFNLMFGFPETQGLDGAGLAP